MKKRAIVIAAVLALGAFASTAFCDVTKGGKIDGKAEFEKHCASCHPNGGNIVNPKKPLTKAAMTANGVKTERDVVAKMRNPGPGMTKFDAKAIPDKEATAIAAYVLKTFK